MALSNFKIEQLLPGIPNGGSLGSSVTTFDLTGCTNVLLPAGTTINGSSLTALGTITSTSATALAVGRQGTTNPAFNVDASTASQADGINIVGKAAGSGAAVSVITSGTNSPLTIDSAGSGTITIAGTSTGAITLGTAVTITSGALTVTSGNVTMTSGNLLLSAGTATVTSANASAFAVGRLGATTPAFQVDASTSTQVTGLKVTGAATTGTVAVAVIQTSGNASLTVDAIGTGTVGINTVGSTSGLVTIGNTSSLAGAAVNGILTVKGALTAGGLLTSAVQVATSGPSVYSGSGVPTISAAVQGSLYMRSDGTNTSTRLYVATNTTGGWTGVTTAA